MSETTPSSLPLRLLAAGVPLTLLLDLVDPNGPDSAAIIAAETVALAPELAPAP